jgi:molecular chaperone DnaJ
VVVETPVNLTKEQKDLVKQLQASFDSSEHSQSPRKSSWFEGVRSFFDDMKK